MHLLQKNNTQTTPSKENIKIAIKTARVEEKIESEDRQKRSANIIIHGVTERENDEKTNIQKWVADIVTDLHASVTVKSVSRIGKLMETSNRPILVAWECRIVLGLS